MRYVRSFLLALTTLAFFLLVLVAGLYVFITPERVSARLANTLSHHLGLKIEMAKLHIDTRLPSLKFTVKDAVLTSADGAVRGSVPSATIRLHPLALFTRSPRISEITTADGSLTFGNTSPEDVRAWIEGTVKPLAFNVDHLVVHRGAVYFSDPLTGPEPWAYVNNASVSISNLSEAGAAYSLNGVIKLPEGVEMVMPGDNIKIDVKLITPIAMEEGLRFAIREGGRTVGSGVVSKIVK